RLTHKPPPDVFEGYTTFEWAVVCAEVAELNSTTTAAMSRQSCNWAFRKQSAQAIAASLVQVLVQGPRNSTGRTENRCGPPRTRTGTPVKATDFQSVSSTNFDRGPSARGLIA